MRTQSSVLLRPAELVDYVLAQIRKKLPSATAMLSIDTNEGYCVTVHQDSLESLEHIQDQTLLLTIYHDQRKAIVSSSDLTEHTLSHLVEQALNMVKFVNTDPYIGLPDKAQLAFDYPQLELYAPWQLTAEAAIERALSISQQALIQHPAIKLVDQMSITNYQARHILANTYGFYGEYQTTYQAQTLDLIAEQDGHMEADGDYTQSRQPDAMMSAAELIELSVDKVVKRLGARKINTQSTPIIFAAPVATSLLRHLSSALNGYAIYQQTSFLADAMGQIILPTQYQVSQQPFLAYAIGSQPFDDEGVKVKEQAFVENGMVKNFIMSSYSARALGLQTTGNSGGVFNLTINHDDVDFKSLLKKMDRGLLVTQLMGQGINLLTGSYSRGAAGFWVENGEIQYPVHEITIAGNLKDMYHNIVAIANDTETRGNYRTGSILIDNMMVAGA